MNMPHAMTQEEIAFLVRQRLWTVFQASAVLAGVTPPKVRGSSNDPYELINESYADDAIRQRVRERYDDIKNGIRAGDIEVPKNTAEIERNSPGRSARVLPESVVRFAINEKLDMDMPQRFRGLKKARPRAQEHSTRILRAVDAVIEEFWLHWEPGQKTTNQKDVMAWLLNKYNRKSRDNLSEREAEMIDRVCRPDSLRGKATHTR
jgi:hypothetical protein